MITVHCYEFSTLSKTNSKKLLLQNLSRYLGKKITSKALSTTKNGKPFVEGLFFSISHCRNKLLQGFSYEGEIGLDIEYINSKRKYLSLAQRYFHPDEAQRLNNLDATLSLSLFYQLWTAKEAYCKYHAGILWHYLSHNFLSKNGMILCPNAKLEHHSQELFSDYAMCLVYEPDNRPIRFIYE